jgi:hypothetical protein
MLRPVMETEEEDVVLGMPDEMTGAKKDDAAPTLMGIPITPLVAPDASV